MKNQLIALLIIATLSGCTNKPETVAPKSVSAVVVIQDSPDLKLLKELSEKRGKIIANNVKFKQLTAELNKLEAIKQKGRRINQVRYDAMYHEQLKLEQDIAKDQFDHDTMYIFYVKKFGERDLNNLDRGMIHKSKAKS